MAHTLKLNIWTFQLRKRRKRDFASIQSYFEESYNKPTKDENFNEFVRAYVQSFNNKFVQDGEATKAFSYDNIDFSSTGNVIHGNTKGGITGIDQDVYGTDDRTTATDHLGKNKVATLPYYFLIWLPYDTNFGIIMTQSYTGASINNVFFDHLQSLFRVHDYSITKSTFVNKERKEKFFNRSTVYKVSLIKTGLDQDSRSKFNTVFAQSHKMKFNLTASGFRIGVNEFLENWTSIRSNLIDLEIENEDDYDLRIFYEDEDNKKAYAEMKNPKLVFPSIYLPENLKVNGKDYPDPVKLHNYCLNELEIIKNELEYNVKSDD